MGKIKLSIDDQIEDMKRKGISFTLCPETEARKFLKNNTYYFKLKAYERNYSNDNKDHMYRNLDFEHLKELSKIDMYLRKMILDMCLDIEHVLKTRLVYDCTINSETDGFDFVSSFLDNNYPIVKAIIDKAKGKSICSDLAAHYWDNEAEILKPMPLWVIVELISFGDFVKLYTFYHQTYKRFPDYSNYLGAIKYLRNASAHSNCLIYSLKKRPEFSKTQLVMNSLSRANRLINEATRIHKMSIPVIHDFVTLLLVYNDLLDTPQNRNMKDRKMQELRYFFLDQNGRILRKSSYFSNNSTLTEAYYFICNVLRFIDNESQKPKHKRLLKTN